MENSALLNGRECLLRVFFSSWNLCHSAPHSPSSAPLFSDLIKPLLFGVLISLSANHSGRRIRSLPRCKGHFGSRGSVIVGTRVILVCSSQEGMLNLCNGSTVWSSAVGKVREGFLEDNVIWETSSCNLWRGLKIYFEMGKANPGDSDVE